MTEPGKNTLDANCISCEPGRKVSIVNGVRQVEVTPDWLSDKLGSPAEQLAQAMAAAEMLGVLKSDGPQSTVQRPAAPPRSHDMRRGMNESQHSNWVTPSVRVCRRAL